MRNTLGSFLAVAAVLAMTQNWEGRQRNEQAIEQTLAQSGWLNAPPQHQAALPIDNVR